MEFELFLSHAFSESPSPPSLFSAYVSLSFSLGLFLSLSVSLSVLFLRMLIRMDPSNGKSNDGGGM